MNPQAPNQQSQPTPPPAPLAYSGSPNGKSPLLAVVFFVLFIVSLAFGVWAYLGKQSAQNDSSKKVDAAVAAAKSQQKSADTAFFADQLKQPYKTFTGPATYGSIKFSYPKTYSAYVDQTSSSEPINAYFYPGEVPSISSNPNYALRVELTTNTYSTVVQSFQNQVQAGSLKSSAYVPAKLAKNSSVQRGVKLTGGLTSTQNGEMIIIPVRDQTLQVYTQSYDFLSDFEKIVLPSLTFSP